jgi:hypothetical protein
MSPQDDWAAEWSRNEKVGVVVVQIVEDHVAEDTALNFGAEMFRHVSRWILECFRILWIDQILRDLL